MVLQYKSPEQSLTFTACYVVWLSSLEFLKDKPVFSLSSVLPAAIQMIPFSGLNLSISEADRQTEIK